MNTFLLYLAGTWLRGLLVALPVGWWSRYGHVRSWVLMLLVVVAAAPFGLGHWPVGRNDDPMRPELAFPVQLSPVAVQAAEAAPKAAVPAAQTSVAIPPVVRGVSSSLGWAGWLGMVYIVATLCWCGLRTGAAWRWQRRLLRYPAVADERLLRLFADARSAVGIAPNRHVELRDSGKNGIGPACFGWRRGIVVCPETVLYGSDDVQFRMLMVHELVHIRRGHPWMNWVVWGLEGIFWFNPGVLALLRRWKVACEVECDAAVGRILRLDRESRRNYAGMLLELASGDSGRWFPAPGASRNARQLQLRMKELIMKTKKIERVWYSVAVLAVLAAIGVWVPMAYAKASPAEDLEAKVAALQPPELKTGKWKEFRPHYKSLIAEKKYEEALVNIVWFWEHMLEHDEGMYGVRLSFLLEDWTALGKLYPPARAEMIRQRDKNEAFLRAGNWRTEYPWVNPDGSVRDTGKNPPKNQEEWDTFFSLGKGDTTFFCDAMALSQALNEPEHLKEFAGFVDREHPEFFKSAFIIIAPDLFFAEDYALLSKYIPDVGPEWEKTKAQLAQIFVDGRRIKEQYPDFNVNKYYGSMVNIARSSSENLAKLARWQGHEEVAARIEKEMNELEPEYRKKIAEEMAKPVANGSSAPEGR